MTFTDVERLCAFDEADRTFQMDEEAFRAFYELTSRPLWAYLARTTGDRRMADDLLQEAYYRLLRTRASFASEDHRRHYLFRIATNLVRDQHRKPRVIEANVESLCLPHPGAHPGDRAVARMDLARAMARLKPRERSLLWLAYAMGWSHDEIAAVLDLKTASLKCLLHRARHRLRGFLSNPQGGSR